jgi:ADP-ribose pyrophosphatase
MHEHIVSTESIYDGRVVKLDLVQVELPDGARGQREVVKHPGAVAIVALDGDDVLLVRQFRLPAGRVLLEVPAGTLEPGEEPLACAERELQEETGYRPGKLEPIGGLYTAPGYTSEYIYLFIATELTESRLAGDEDEFIELARMPLREALNRIDGGEIVDGKTITGLLLAARRRAADAP